ncbi:unnamed protein product [Cuscuta campestris]|uniref:Uncharacterized protein n=1 Tax=Cuscuta campestris TaxID=132261 RepID=A0A484M7L6_9ASTE|nr:unnamed protein product [Cuscuta campestris]
MSSGRLGQQRAGLGSGGYARRALGVPRRLSTRSGIDDSRGQRNRAPEMIIRHIRWNTTKESRPLMGKSGSAHRVEETGGQNSS